MLCQQQKCDSARIQALPSLQYDSRPDLSRPLLIYIAADRVYFEQFAYAAIQGIDHNCADAAVHLHLFASFRKVAQTVRKLKASLKNVSLSVSWERRRYAWHGNWQGRVYYSGVRFVRLYQIASNHPTPILALDADSVVRATAGDILRQMAGVDLSFVVRPEAKKEKWDVATGTLFLRPSDQGLLFMQRFAGEIAYAVSRGEARWYYDQRIASRLLRYFGDRLQFRVLPVSMADWHFAENSLIWAGKGSRKQSDPRFTEALRRKR